MKRRKLDANPFDCASLPICDITCGGPSVQVRARPRSTAPARRVVAPRDDLALRGRLCYFPRPPTFSFLDCGRALSVELAPPDRRRIWVRGVVRYRREPGRRRRARVCARGLEATARAWLCVGRLKVIGAVLVHAAQVSPLAGTAGRRRAPIDARRGRTSAADLPRERAARVLYHNARALFTLWIRGYLG